MRKAALSRLLLAISEDVGESKRGKDESQWSRSSSVISGLLEGLNLKGGGISESWFCGEAQSSLDPQEE